MFPEVWQDPDTPHPWPAKWEWFMQGNSLLRCGSAAHQPWMPCVSNPAERQLCWQLLLLLLPQAGKGVSRMGIQGRSSGSSCSLQVSGGAVLRCWELPVDGCGVTGAWPCVLLFLRSTPCLLGALAGLCQCYFWD